MRAVTYQTMFHVKHSRACQGSRLKRRTMYSAHSVRAAHKVPSRRYNKITDGGRTTFRLPIAKALKVRVGERATAVNMARPIVKKTTATRRTPGVGTVRAAS